MKIYNSYQEAKIENPDFAIFNYQGKFGTDKDIIDYFDINSASMKECCPADYCITLGELRDLHGGEVVGDVILGYRTGRVRVISKEESIDREFDAENFVLRSAVMEIPTQSNEDREALDMIDTTSKQVESLANDSESPNGSKYDRTVGGPVKLSPPEWSGDRLPPVGVECEILFKEHPHKGFGLFNVLAYHGGAIWVQYIGPLGNHGKCYTAECSTLEFRKPESPEQKAERERLEAAYDLYCDWCRAIEYPKFSFEQFKKTKKDLFGMLAIVDKTGYRKESK